MSDLAGHSLWRVSAYDELRNAAASAAQGQPQRQTILSTTLQGELRVIDRHRDGGDPLEVIAACVRLRESALIYLQCDEGVWPVTLFPQNMLYHSPRNIMLGTTRALASLKILEIEPPGVRPPGHWMYERIAKADSYHPLTPALWRLALNGPRTELLKEISGAAAFRVLRSLAAQDLTAPGALAPAAERLRKESAALRTIATWPGMSVERASRLVNALYLTSNVIVSRAHHSARPGMLEWLLGRRAG